MNRNSTFCAAAFAAILSSVSGQWTVDMRELLEEGQNVYLEAGESFEAHFKGNHGTGYSWINSHQYETNEIRRVKFNESIEVHDNDYANDWAEEEEFNGFRPVSRHGSEVSVF